MSRDVSQGPYRSGAIQVARGILLVRPRERERASVSASHSLTRALSLSRCAAELDVCKHTQVGKEKEKQLQEDLRRRQKAEQLKRLGKMTLKPPKG